MRTTSILVSFFLLAACTNDKKPVRSGAPDSGDSTAEQCDDSKRPILFVHGIMGGADNFELQAQRFTSNGYCKEAIRAYDYDATYLAFGGAPPSATDDNI